MIQAALLVNWFGWQRRPKRSRQGAFREQYAAQGADCGHERNTNSGETAEGQGRRREGRNGARLWRQRRWLWSRWRWRLRRCALYRLDELPPGINQDEGAHGVDALRVLEGEHAVFFTGHGGREGMVVYAVALATALIGRTLLATHLPGALASAVDGLRRLLAGLDSL